MKFVNTLKQWWVRVRCPTEFLCDNCRHDYRNTCAMHQQAYPNATKCPYYEPK